MLTEHERRAFKLGAAIQAHAHAVGEFAVREDSRSRAECESTRNTVEKLVEAMHLDVPVPRFKNWKQAIRYFEGGEQAELIAKVDEQIRLIHSADVAAYFQFGDLSATYVNLDEGIRRMAPGQQVREFVRQIGRGLDVRPEVTDVFLENPSGEAWVKLGQEVLHPAKSGFDSLMRSSS